MRAKLKKTFLIITFISLGALIFGCNNKAMKEKEVILIDKIERENNIETKILYKILLEEEPYEEYSFSRTFINNNIFKIIGNFDYEKEDELENKNKVTNVKMGKISEEKDEKGFNIVKWKDLNIEGYLLGTRTIKGDYKILNENKVYKIKDNGDLEEIPLYRLISEEEKKSSWFYTNLYNDEANVLNKQHFENGSIIDIKNNKVIKFDENLEVFKNPYNIIRIDNDRIYVSYLEGDLRNSQDRILKIGYIENNKFFNIFEDESLVIKSQALREIEYGWYIYTNILINKDKMIFSGSINEVNGVWSYDINSKELKLEIELEKYTVADMCLNESEEYIAISVKGGKENEISYKYSEYLLRVNEKFEITAINNILYKNEGNELKKFVGFYDEDKIVYSSYYKDKEDTNEDDYKLVYEIYEISN